MALAPLLGLPVGGLPKLLTREVAGFSHEGKWALYRGVVRAAHGWVLLMTALVLIGFWLAGSVGGLIPQTGKWSLLCIALMLVPLRGLNAVRNGTIKGLGFPALAELPAQVIRPLLLLASVAAFAAMDMLTAASALWAQVGVAALAVVVASVLFYRIRPKSTRGLTPQYDNRNWLFALLPLTLVVLVSTFNAQVAIVLLGTLGSDEAVAGLRVAERGAQFVLLSLTLVNIVISPHIVKSHHDNDIHSIQKLSRQSARGAILIGLPIGLILMVFGKLLIGIVFGEEYIQTAYPPLAVLVCGYLFQLLAGSSAILLVMCGYEKLTLFCQLAGLVVMIVLSLILIPLFLALGAALAVTAGIVVYTVLQALAVKQCLKIRPGIF